jgi:HEAT repeat protein
MRPEIHAAIDKFRRGDEEAAFFDLIELEGDVLPALIELFRSDSDVALRSLLVRVAWERRDPAALALLADALGQHDEEIWQEALDGLVTFASPESLVILQQARQRRHDDEAAGKRFRLWLEEAIHHVEFELRR